MGPHSRKSGHYLLTTSLLELHSIWKDDMSDMPGMGDQEGPGSGGDSSSLLPSILAAIGNLFQSTGGLWDDRVAEELEDIFVDGR